MHSFIRTFTAPLAVLGLSAVVASATPITIEMDYSNVAGGAISFDGHSHFSFSPTTNDFQVTSPGSVAGLLGQIGGTYTIGAVTTVGSVSSASVTGTGVFSVHDGHGFDLTGNLTWVNIVQFGTGDFLNTSGTVNLTSIAYHGANTVLQELAMTPSTAEDVLSFQFTPAKKLSVLKTTATHTSFSGSVYATRNVSEGGDIMMLLGLGFAGLALFRRKVKA